MIIPIIPSNKRKINFRNVSLEAVLEIVRSSSSITA